MATYSGGVKIKQAATGGYVLGANEYAEVSYSLTATGNPSSGAISNIYNTFTRIYGPGETIASSFNITIFATVTSSSSVSTTGTLTFLSGVIFEN